MLNEKENTVDAIVWVHRNYLELIAILVKKLGGYNSVSQNDLDSMQGSYLVYRLNDEAIEFKVEETRSGAEKTANSKNIICKH